MRGLAKRVAAIKASSQKLPTHLRCALFKSTASTPWPILLRLLLGILTSKVLGARSRGLVDYIDPSQASIYMGNCSTPEGVRGVCRDMRWHDISNLKQSRKKQVEGGVQCDGGRLRRRQPFLSSQSALLPERKGGPATAYCMSSDNVNHFELLYVSTLNVVHRFFCTVAVELRI